MVGVDNNLGRLDNDASVQARNQRCARLLAALKVLARLGRIVNHQAGRQKRGLDGLEHSERVEQVGIFRVRHVAKRHGQLGPLLALALGADKHVLNVLM